MQKRKTEALYIQKCLDPSFIFDLWFIWVYNFRVEIIFPLNFEGISPFSASVSDVTIKNSDANLIFDLLLINCFSSLKAFIYSLTLSVLKLLQECALLWVLCCGYNSVTCYLFYKHDLYPTPSFPLVSFY